MRADAWQRGAGCPHPHHKIHVKDASAGSCLFPPRQGGGRGDVRDARHNPPHPLPAHPARQTAPPTLPPGPPSPERRRDQLLSGTGGSFVTLLLLSHAGASPSPSSRHRVPPHIPPTAPPRRRPRGQGATSASATGRRRYGHRGGGRSAGGISGGTPRGDTWGDTATHGDALRRPRGCRWRSRFSKAFPVGNAKDGRTDGGTERGFHAYQRSR